MTTEKKTAEQIIHEQREMLTACQRTFGKFHEIVKVLKEAPADQLPALVENIDIDFELIQTKIKDAIILHS